MQFSQAIKAVIDFLEEIHLSSFCAASNCPWPHSSTKRLAICPVAHGVLLVSLAVSRNDVLALRAGGTLDFFCRLRT